jgi:hypothetical protein
MIGDCGHFKYIDQWVVRGIIRWQQLLHAQQELQREHIVSDAVVVRGGRSGGQGIGGVDNPLEARDTGFDGKPLRQPGDDNTDPEREKMLQCEI